MAGAAPPFLVRRPDPRCFEREADAAMALQLAALAAALPGLPHPHTPAEDAAWIRERFARDSVWLAVEGDEVVGIATRAGDTIVQFFVRPDRWGRGIGKRLLERILAECPEPALWTFQRNARARRFYERNGFVAVVFTEGSGNEEKEPDVRYVRQVPPA